MAGVLTDFTSGLREAIAALRSEREQLFANLARQTRTRRRAVSALCADLGMERARMARGTSANRSSFLSGVRSLVAAGRDAVQTDLVGARQAWAGHGCGPAAGPEAPGPGLATAADQRRPKGKKKR